MTKKKRKPIAIKKKKNSIRETHEREMKDFPFPENIDFASVEDFNVWKSNVDAWLKKEVQALEELLLKYDPFDMIANLSITQLPIDWDTYKEATHEGLAPVIEYVALLYLKHPYNVATELAIDGRILDEIIGRTKNLLQAIILRYALEASPGLAPGLREQFRYLTITNELFVRSPGYYDHQKERLLAIFAPVEEWLVAHLGFTVSDVLRIEEAIPELIDGKFSRRREQAKREERELLSELHNYSQGEIIDQEHHALLEYLSKLGPSKAKAYARNMAMGWLFSFLGTAVYSFTVEELVQHCGVDRARAKAVLRFFSIEFGQIEPDYFLLSPTHELKTYPILRNNDAYLCPLPGTIIWAIQPRLEEILNPNTHKYPETSRDIWQRYESNRAKFLENEVVRLFRLALQHADIYQNLSYEIVENRVKKATELDVLVCFDTSLLLIETKAGAFTAPARRGAKDRMVSDLKSLLGVAHSQAVRAKTYIDSSDNPKFKLQNGTEVTIERQRFERIFLVTITLEPLDVFNTIIYDLEKINILEEGELPWALSLDALRVICELIEFPSQLIHYLLRRLRLNEIQKVIAHDELDWFGHYLSTGLFFEKEAKAENNTYLLLSHTSEFDDYYLYEMGVRTKPAPKPRQQMPPRLREIIQELEAVHFQGYSEVILMLLDYDEKARSDFSEFFDSIRSRTKEDGRRHDFSIVSSEAKSGISTFSTLSPTADPTLAQLDTYVRLKKYQQRADRWLGILTVVDYPGLAHGLVILNSRWTPDSELDDIVADFFPRNSHLEAT